jgi:tetratricopeptide (TPR) repeat protein
MRYHVLFAIGVLACSRLAAQQEAAASPSPVQQRAAAAEKRVQSNPSSPQTYNDLAFALCRWARDNGDARLYTKAESALKRSFQLSPGNYEARKLQVTALLGKHEFAEALKSATELNHEVPDDIGGWALLVDANTAVGNYTDAEHAAQWILDLRAGSSLGFAKAAILRDLLGDSEGATEFFMEAYKRTAQSDADECAWLLLQSARVELTAGETEKADDLVNQALKLFPDSGLAVATLAAVRSAQGKYAEAANMMEQCYRAVSSEQNLYDWAQALDRAGEKDRALTAYRDFEVKAGAQRNSTYNWNRQLIFYYTDHNSNPREALALAGREAAIRHDSATLDAYAWALYQNGRYGEAEEKMDRALAVGVRDPVYFCHAVRIATKANDATAAARFEKELANLRSTACPVEHFAQSQQQVAR